MASQYQDYDLFLSHATEDKEWVLPLAERLKRANVRVWLDAWEILPGDNIVTRINDGITRSRQMAVVWTRTYFDEKKTWTIAEQTSRGYVDAAAQKRLLIPLKKEDCQVPPLCEALLWIDFRNADQFETGIEQLIGALVRTPGQSAPASAPASPARPTAAPAPASSRNIIASLTEFNTVVIFGALFIFLAVLAFGALLVFRGSEVMGVTFVSLGLIGTFGFLFWFCSRLLNGSALSRQEFAFARSAAAQVATHSAIATP